MTSSPSPDERRRWRAELRRHHPDLGGDAEQFLRTLRAWESRPASALAGAEVRFVHRPRGARRVLAWWRARRSPAPRRVV
ncbi:hypothetical protein SAMN06893096_1018 [Geodermatophilus pulveris]|uniref:Uncharacterized protein n=1 Tax=Geodermatophilus pulveris TaxID=1564159 RepID=A0A239AIG6_9ACTN|nr:hypothetical protein [Geodermatophilus pulveris]SNR95132.1 hypothetical protein SAMN06893096_1018 [Geodermatophilus pulveris]